MPDMTGGGAIAAPDLTHLGGGGSAYCERERGRHRMARTAAVWKIALAAGVALVAHGVAGSWQRAAAAGERPGAGEPGRPSGSWRERVVGDPNHAVQYVVPRPGDLDTRLMKVAETLSQIEDGLRREIVRHLTDDGLRQQMDLAMRDLRTEIGRIRAIAEELRS